MGQSVGGTAMGWRSGGGNSQQNKIQGERDIPVSVEHRLGKEAFAQQWLSQLKPIG